MKTRPLRTLSALLCATCFCAWQSHADYRVRGRYVNEKYVYSVRVPAGAFAYRAAAPAPNHGFAIFPDAKQRDLIKDPAIFVDGSFDAQGLASAEKLTAQTASGFGSDYHLTVVRDAPSHLAGLDAREVIMRGTNGPGSINYIHLLVAFRPIPNSEVGICYTIWLQSRSEDPKMEATFEALVKSFALMPIPSR